MYKDDLLGSRETENSETDKFTHSTIGGGRKVKEIRMKYFTDPLSPAGYAMDQQLKNLTVNYGRFFEIEYHMGGLIPLWELYRNNGIGTHSEMANWWRNAGDLYNLPITGAVWLTDPPQSSFPPSIAFKASQLQGKQKSLAFLRRMMEMLFLENKNICNWKYLEVAAQKSKLDIGRLKQDQVGKGRRHFEEDLLLNEKFGVMGFPTLFIMGSDSKWEAIEGFQRYDQLELKLLKMMSSQSDG
ncbi:MAG: DsbA family protein [Cyclobacteriaceae bacterium]|nr:DsbA family protein [Cyclobacteriaceae bacterium]